jgi:hypothetical protein
MRFAKNDPLLLLLQASTNDVLKTETKAIFGQGNDAFGDGNKRGCEEMSLLAHLTVVEKSAILVAVLFFVGLILACSGYFCYNRYMSEGVW